MKFLFFKVQRLWAVAHGLVSKQDIPDLKQDYESVQLFRYFCAVTDDTAQSGRYQPGI